MKRTLDEGLAHDDAAETSQLGVLERDMAAWRDRELRRLQGLTEERKKARKAAYERNMADLVARTFHSA